MTLVNDTDGTPDCPIDNANRSAHLTILNDDPAVPPTISIADASFAEGDGQGHNEPVIVTSSPTGTQLPCEVNFALASGTANGQDFQLAATGGAMNIGDTSKSFTAVRIFGDTVLEGNETFTIRLVNDTDANLDCPIGPDDEATITILDDDTANTIRRMTIADVSVNEGNTGTTPMTFNLVLDGPANGDETVQIDTVAASAESGVDYQPITAQVVSFAAGQTSALVIVDVIGDTVDETVEEFTLAPTNQQNVNLGLNHATGRIEDDDGGPARLASIGDASVLEGNAGTSIVGLTISLDSPAVGNEVVTVMSGDLSATAGSDYTFDSRTVSFTAGQTTRTVAVTILGDTTIEPDESLNLTLTNPQNVGLADPVGQVTILNDDTTPPPPPPPTRSVVVGNATVVEGNSGTSNLVFPLTLDGPANGNETVTVSTGNGTAAAGSDYVAVTGQVVTFAVGQTSRSVTVLVNGDTTVEPDETLNLSLSAPVNLTVAAGVGVGTVTNDDSAPPPPPSPAGVLKVSRSANRSAAVELQANNWSAGESVYVFLETALAGTRVQFFLDGSTSVFQTEGAAPWDFKGGSSTTANPFVNTLPAGSHSIRALMTRTDGSTFAVTSTFTVAGSTTTTTTTTTTTARPPTSSSGLLKVSRSANRSSSVALEGNQWSRGELVYVFLDTAQAGTRVQFFLDNATTPLRTEGAAPWDFGGGGTATANPFTNTLSAGTHSIRAVLTRTDNTTRTFTSTFSVKP